MGARVRFWVDSGASMISSQKHLFDIPDDVAYLNNAYMSPLMKSVSARMAEAGQLKAQPWTYRSDQFFSFAEEARGLAARIYGSVPDNVAIVPSASYGVQIAANNVSISKGQNIITLADQFPSHIYPWRARAAREGANIITLSTPAGHDWTPHILDSINSDTAVVAVPQTHWMSGATLDLVAIRQKLDAVGGALVLDLTQSLGGQPFDAKKVRPDFAVAATYKWMMGPYTLGFLYVDPKHHGGVPLEENWINRAGAENFAALTDYQDAYADGARRFDMGEKSNPAQLGGASAAMTQILEWGVDNIAQALAAKGRYILKALESLGFSAPEASVRAPHYLGVVRDGAVPEDLLAQLAEQNIFVSVRGTTIRITPHLYATDEDVERFIKALNIILNE